jgi:hypothetical protein
MKLPDNGRLSKLRRVGLHHLIAYSGWQLAFDP